VALTILASLLLPVLASAADGELAPASGPRDPQAPSIKTAITAKKIFYDAEQRIKLRFQVDHVKSVTVQVELVRAEDGKLVKTFKPKTLAPGELDTVKWDGKARGKAVRDGRYQFRVTAVDDDGAKAETPERGDASRDAFGFYGHIFPIRGKHDYGEAGARFGAGRGGRSHQGQDAFADCGTDLVAARGGKVQARQYHEAAGNYLVIDGRGTDDDYVYMHLKKPSPRKEGETVTTGQRIGAVGDSGNAAGCHLHFELWSRPGWYEGGKPYDPLPSLKGWDDYS
jgi:murein DD-endopeptidase MepM/ murein hydrolase activator NlpD